MSILPKELLISPAQVKKAKDPEELKAWLVKLVVELQMIYKKLRFQAESNGLKTNTWRMREDDNGDLVFQKWNGTTWVTGQKLKAS